GNGRRILGARWHFGCILPGIRQTGARGSLWRPAGIHSPLRRGIAAVDSQGRRGVATTVDGIPEVAGSAGGTRRTPSGIRRSRARSAAARRAFPRLGTAGSHGPTAPPLSVLPA